MNLTTPADLAEQFGLTEKKLHELRKLHRWPHVRLGRFDIRFTAAQVEQIIAMHTAAPKKTETQTVTVAGQTAKSAGRRRTA